MGFTPAHEVNLEVGTGGRAARAVPLDGLNPIGHDTAAGPNRVQLAGPPSLDDGARVIGERVKRLKPGLIGDRRARRAASGGTRQAYAKVRLRLREHLIAHRLSIVEIRSDQKTASIDRASKRFQTGFNA